MANLFSCNPVPTVGKVCTLLDLIQLAAFIGLSDLCVTTLA